MDLTPPDFVAIARRNGIPITADEILEELRKELEEQGSIINNNSEFSPFWRLIEEGMAKPYEHELNTLLNVVMPQSFILTSDGESLDARLWEVGLERGTESSTVGFITLKREPNSPAISIPVGFGVSTERINGEVYRVQTRNPHLLPASEETSQIEVIAESPGAIYNLGAGFYRIPDYDLPGVIQMYNDENWIDSPGTDEEAVDSARLRYRDRFSSGNWHIDSLYRSIITEFGGVESDTIYFEHEAPRGPGTANFYLLLNKDVDPEPILERINTAIAEGYHGNGDDMMGFPMEEQETDLTCTVWINGLDDDAKSELLANVESFIRCAFRENDLYEDITRVLPQSRFSISRLGQEIHRNFPTVDSVSFDISDLQTQLNIYRLDNLTVSEGA